MKKIKLVASLTMLGSLTACSGLQELGENYGSTIIGCAVGAVGGYMVNQEKGALIGLVGGCGAGYYFDQRKKRIKEIVRNNNMDVDFETSKVIVKDNRGKQLANAQLLSTSLVKTNMFKSGRASLSQEAKAAFITLAAQYKASASKIMVVGHSDSDGPAIYNQRLSEARAKVVANLLVREGVAKHNVFYQGVGESQPVATNTTAQGKVLNRRVEIVEIGEEAAAKKGTKKLINNKTAEILMAQYANISAKNIRNLLHREPPKVVAKVKERAAKVDFKGVKATASAFKLVSLVGAAQRPLFSASLFSKAYADNDAINHSCLHDEPVKSGLVKRFSNGKSIKYHSDEYLPGMNKSVWTAYINKNLVALSPVAVLRDGGKVIVNPKISIYNNYQDPSAKPNYQLSTQVNTFIGKKGVLYRVFVNDKSAPVTCIDIVIPRTGHTSLAKGGELFYRDGTDSMVASYSPKKI